MAADLTAPEHVFESVLPSHFKRLALAVSGGSDSVALLRLAAEFQNNNPQAPEFIVLSVDHKLRPGSGHDAEFVANLAKSLGLKAHILNWDGEKPQTGIQEAARRARYSLMRETCCKLGVDALVTAHTMDDQAETFLMRLKRGSGLDGLSSMSLFGEFEQFPILRPLLTLRREVLRNYLKAEGIEWVEDPSNDDLSFERVRVRGELPQLEEMGFSTENLAQSASRLLRAREVIESCVQTAITDLVTWYDAGCCKISNAEFSQQSEEIALRVFSHALLGVGGGEREPQLKKIEHALDSWKALSPGEGFTLAGCQVIMKRDETLIVREMARQDEQKSKRHLNIRMGEKTVWDRRFLCELSTSGKFEDNFTENSDLLVRPLGEKGWHLAKEHKNLAKEMPSYIGRSLVSLWDGEHLVSVPHIGLIDKNIHFEVRFMPRGVVSKPEIETYLR